MIGRHGRWFVPLGPWTCRWKKIKHVDHATALLKRLCHTCVPTSGVPVGMSGHDSPGYQRCVVQDTNGAGDEVESLTILGCRRWGDRVWRGGARGRGREQRAGGWGEHRRSKNVRGGGGGVGGGGVGGRQHDPWGGVRLFSVTDFG
jgi:hypothetical protein